MGEEIYKVYWNEHYMWQMHANVYIEGKAHNHMPIMEKEYRIREVNTGILKDYLKDEAEKVEHIKYGTSSFKEVFHYSSSTLVLDFNERSSLKLRIFSGDSDTAQGVLNELELMLVHNFQLPKREDIEREVREAEAKLRDSYKCPGVIVPDKETIGQKI